MPLATGTVIDGKYRIIDEVGKGNMGNVYRATVERSGKIWAIKEVRNDIIPRNEKEAEMLKIYEECLHKEIEILRSLNGSAVPMRLRSKIPSIADVIEDKCGNLIIVMDFIEGDSLKNILERKGARSEARVIKWAKQLCDILGFLHSKGIIYRDMKPENVMLQENDEVAIIDFGTAREYQTLADGTTALGSPGYAAPEQCDPRETDARTDIFCLGKTMYSLLTGIDLQRNLAIDTSDLKERNPMISSELCEIIEKCTKRSPDKRYQSSAELLYALENIVENSKKSKRKKVVKMCLFSGTFCFSVVSGIFGYLLNLQSKALATDNYQELLDDASVITINSQDDDYVEKHAEKISLYEQAIDVPNKAGEKDAYLGLIEAYKENDMENPVFSKEEADQITNLMSNHKADFETNKENYVEICYEIGNLYWYYYDDKNQITKSIYAINWFQEVTKNADENYDKRKQGLAEAYAAIGIFYRDNVTLVTEARDDKTYDELLRNLQDLMDGIATNKDEADIVRLEVLEMARYALQRYATDFKRDGVDEDRLIALHKRIETVLNSIDVEYYGETHPLYIKKSEIEANMADTENAVRNAYGTTRKEAKTS